MIDYNVLLSEKIDIIELVSKYTKINKKGNNYIGLCPIHNEDTPSFNVNKDKKVYHCFGCNSGGNVISFVMAMYNVDFLKSVNILCEMYNIKTDNSVDEYQNKNNEIIERLNKNLKQNKFAFDYLIKRNFTNEFINYFNLGVISNLDSDVLFEKKEMFNNRIIIPIQDKNGKYVALAGRSINDIKPKYINSSSKFYNKNEVLYGYYQSKEYIKNTRTAIIVEGYFDVIKMHQQGIKNVVACCSSFLSEEQIMILLPISEKIILCFDGDSAGLNANVKAIENCLKLNICPKICLLTGKDPDETIDLNGVECLVGRLKNCISVIDALFIIYKKMERTKLFETIKNIINKSKNNIVKNDLYVELNLKLGNNTKIEKKIICNNDNEYTYTIEGMVINYFFYNYEYFLKYKDIVFNFFSDNILTQKLINILYYDYDGKIENIKDELVKKFFIKKPEIDINIDLLINKLTKKNR